MSYKCSFSGRYFFIRFSNSFIPSLLIADIGMMSKKLYSIVQVELFEDEEALIKIHAVIFVVRNSQKQIVIGKNGNTLKKIGKQARIEIEDYFNKKVFLKTWVKVKKNWNTDSDYLQSLGVGGSYD